VRQRAPIIHNDYASLDASQRKGLPEGHAPVIRELVVPVMRGRNIVCILGVGNKPVDYTRQDVEIVAQMADLAWDIAERKKAEQALQNSQKLLAQTESIGNVGGWELDIDSGQQTWTEEIYKIHEVDQTFNPTQGNGIDFYTPDSRPVIQQAVQRAVEKGEPFDLDLEITTARGNLRWVHAIGKADLDHRRISGFFQDITARKQAELGLIAAQAILEQRVLERTADLQAANITLEKALNSRDEFLSAMSHELRTPLVGVLGLAQVLQLQTYGPLAEKQNDALKMIEVSGQRLLAMINDILDYSHIQSGRITLDKRFSSLGEICQSALYQSRVEAAKKHQETSLTINPDPVTLQVDARRLNQILIHLLSNASKFTKEGGKFGIDVTGSREEKQVRITVWDNGMGIKKEDFPRLFKPFVQLDGSLAREYSGTGLGLVLVKSLVDLHGGKVTVESTPGAGSRFTVSLPWET